MSNIFNKVFGCPKEANTDYLTVDSSGDSVALIPGETYRIVSTQSCYINFGSNPSTSQATTAGVLMIASLPEVFTATENDIYLSVVKVDTDGTMCITRMVK